MADGKIGVLSDRELAALFESSAIKSQSALDADQVQPASLDLRLGFEAHRIRASFLPGDKRRIADVLADPGTELHRISLTDEGAVLETGCVYLVPLQESLRLPAGISGRANPKSSTGRIDVFTRVVTNRSKAFDDVPTGYSGPLWLEISPRTFPILVRPGTGSLSFACAAAAATRRRRKPFPSISTIPSAGRSAGGPSAMAA